MNQTVTQQILQRLNALEAAIGQPVAEPEQHLPTTAVARRYNVTPRSVDRWVDDPDLGFPKPVIMNKRKYWSIRALVDYDRKVATAVNAPRRPTTGAVKARKAATLASGN
jgi:hypothetical protein